MEFEDKIPEDAPRRTGAEVTIAEVDALLATILEKEEAKEKLSEQVTELNKEIARLEAQATQYLKDLDREKYESPLAKVKIEQKWRVNLPADEAAKKELFEHLRKRGIFDKYATVNSNSLNSLYMADWEAAKEEGKGIEFYMPGIDAPKLFEKLNVKPIKKKG